MGRRGTPDLHVDQALQFGLMVLQGIGCSAASQRIVAPGDGIFELTVTDLAPAGDFHRAENFDRSAHHAS
jgi:hypothetical protein